MTVRARWIAAGGTALLAVVAALAVGSGALTASVTTTAGATTTTSNATTEEGPNTPSISNTPSIPNTEPAAVLTRSGPEPAPGPVVIIPGYGGQTALLQPLVDALRADGRTVHVVTGLGDATSRLQAQARIVGRQIDGLLAGGAPSVDVIGFSQGGLVTRLWTRDGGQAHVRRVVTLGAPHHGSRVAALAQQLAPKECPAACRQLVPGSAFLDGLGDSAPGPGWISIWTSSDRISTPARTAVLDGAVSFAVQDVCPGVPVAHGMLPRTRFVVDLVADALEAPKPLISAPRQAAVECPPQR